MSRIIEVGGWVAVAHNYVPTGICMLDAPHGTTLSLLLDSGDMPARVTGFSQPGVYRFFVYGLTTPDEFTVQVEAPRSATGGSAIISPPRANLFHALTLGAKVTILFAQNKDTRNYEVLATPPPTVLPGMNQQAIQAAKDSAFLSAIRTLIGMNQDQIAQAMSSVTVGSAVYQVTPDVTGGPYVFGGKVSINGTATLSQTFTLAQSLWGGSAPPDTLACTNKPAGSAVTSATLQSVTYPGTILPAWTAAIAAASTAAEQAAGSSGGWEFL